MSNDKPKVPPNDLEAEKTVLGAVLTHPDAFHDVGALAGDDFYDPRHGSIWTAMRALQRDGKPIDALTLAEEMTRADTLKTLATLGGAAYFTDLEVSVQTYANVGHHANRLRSKARRRKWLSYGRKVVALALDEGTSDQEFVADAVHGAHELQVTDGPADPLVRMHEVMKDYHRAFEQRWDARKNGQESFAMMSGIDALDVIVGGFAAGDLVVIAGRPGMGKTTFTMNMILNAAQASDPCASAIFSYEMRQRKLAEKFIAQASGIAAHKLKHATLSPDEWAKLTRTESKLAGLPIWISEHKGDCYEVGAHVRRWAARNKIRPSNDTKPTGSVMIDYAQIVKASDPRQNRERQIAEISREFKSLALDIAMPVFLLSQLNRGVEERDDKRPRVSDLRESGAIEQDADTILLLYREFAYTKKPEDANKTEVIVGKARDGETGTADIEWDAKTQRFRDGR